jgi:glycosyltransferase involved in cell wall biosynthesis
MRVLHVTHQYYPAVGGAERYFTELSEELAARGHRVDVFTSRSADYLTWKNSLPAYEVIQGVHIHRFRSLPRGKITWRLLDFGLQNYFRTRNSRYEPFILYGNGPVSPGFAAALMQRIPGYDIVHINNLHYAHGWVASRAAFFHRVPVAVTPHVHMQQPETFDTGYMRRILRHSRIVFAVTEAERQALCDRDLTRNAVVAGNALRLERFPPLDRAAARARFGLSPDAFVVLFLGRKTLYKGLSTCLDAFAALRRRSPNAVFLAVGPETDDSRRLWNERAPLDGVVVRGSVSDVDRLAALAACDVLVLPSSAEAFGIVFLEAWAYAKPVIGADIESIASVIDDSVNGFLVDPRDPGQLAQRLALLADQPDLARRLGEQGNRKLHARYTWQRTGNIVEGAYARAHRRPSSARGTPACV